MINNFEELDLSSIADDRTFGLALQSHREIYAKIRKFSIFENLDSYRFFLRDLDR
jgi:hypothetical protein